MAKKNPPNKKRVKHLNVPQDGIRILGIQCKQKISDEIHLSFPEMPLWAHKITFAKWSVSGRGTLRPSWMVAFAEGGEKWEPDSLVTEGITELSIECMESSETPRISKVSRAYPQILTEHLLVARWTPDTMPWPGSPNSEPWSMDLFHLIKQQRWCHSWPLTDVLQSARAQEPTEDSHKPHCLPKTWVAGQAPLLRSHSENTEIQAVARYSTKECLDCTRSLCSCYEVSFHLWADLCAGGQHDTMSCRNHKPLTFLLEEERRVSLFYG